MDGLGNGSLIFHLTESGPKVDSCPGRSPKVRRTRKDRSERRYINSVRIIYSNTFISRGR